MSAAATTYWRIAGLTYLQYTSKAAGVLRAALKEPLRTKTMAKEKIFFKRLEWSSKMIGQPVGPLKVEVTSLK
ncbi:hypothetical protein NSK_000383 [Nannochloropsis salina CCMP1776]|uniref:ATP synthase subunit epsilon, mitochondrial n=1 Tax=Nannochloropsis salina CCMP1776 TaxID=1027361 RepID=A0A4D9DGU2_9STRA|nr:hypothetical protein NSK_000383 [Nannochloropsis salina CCMP1776]|eukprot:TFJ88029.1 hypothetical protein NSK_000383 [Nannochloropsis salina CCMP1776]